MGTSRGGPPASLAPAWARETAAGGPAAETPTEDDEALPGAGDASVGAAAIMAIVGCGALLAVAGALLARRSGR